MRSSTLKVDPKRPMPYKLKLDPKDKHAKAQQAELVASICKSMDNPSKAKEIWDACA